MQFRIYLEGRHWEILSMLAASKICLLKMQMRIGWCPWEKQVQNILGREKFRISLRKESSEYPWERKVQNILGKGKFYEMSRWCEGAVREREILTSSHFMECFRVGFSSKCFLDPVKGSFDRLQWKGQLRGKKHILVRLSSIIQNLSSFSNIITTHYPKILIHHQPK